MIAPALPPAAVEAARPAMALEGRTAEGRRVVLEVRSGAVRTVRVGVLRYGCGRFGDVGPVVVAVRGVAPVGRDGRFHLRAGPAAERLAFDGRLGRGGRAVAGSLRLTGTIATGEPCSSARISFRAAAKASS
ncbi:MAG: hypothetical protein QOH43_1576 [Solirubrobacteraceae bacterium]|nr:hypothetical protein [Solirubrobacteraceae bacterium]